MEPRTDLPVPEASPPGRLSGLDDLGLDVLLTEVTERLRAVVVVNDRMRELLEAVVAVSAGLDLNETLHRIAVTAADLADARYAAVGVHMANGMGLAGFITAGIPEQEARLIGPPPTGRGLLGALVADPEPMRLADLTRDPRAAGFPPDHPPMHTLLSVPIRVRDWVFGNLYVTEKLGGRKFTAEDQQLLEALASAAGIAVENARLYEEGLRRERWIAGAAEVTTVMLASDDAHVALAIAAEQIRELAEADLAMILLPTGDGGLRVSHATGDAAEFVLGEYVSGGGIAERLLAGDLVVTEDLSTDALARYPVSKMFGPSMGLPLQSARRVIGAIAVWRAVGAAPFTEDEQSHAQAFAAQAALALRLAEGQRDQQRLAVFEDRDRIARDLHDLVIQRLFATGMLLESAARLAQVPEVATRIGRGVDELDATIQEVRTAIYALQHDDTPADGGDLRRRILREANQAAAPLGFKPSVAFVGPVGTMVGESLARQLVPALREMLSNAARHARASAVAVTVDVTVHIDPEGRPVSARPEPRPGNPDPEAEAEPEADEDEDVAEALRAAGAGRPGVLLTVADDGVGIPPGGRRSGLRNLAERAGVLGGDAWNEPGPEGRGTVVSWTALL